MAEYKCTYYWLLELFEVRVSAEQLSMPYAKARYADKALEKIIDRAWDAHWFATKEEAESFLDKVPPAPEGLEWRATDHGFCGE